MREEGSGRCTLIITPDSDEFGDFYFDYKKSYLVLENKKLPQSLIDLAVNYPDTQVL
ncbi:MAG: hypothetical protein F6K47_31050 [Symploca sp. SIO2E6]|nr:hypothetical protein [Symploca sp. SIO2E6]